MIWLDFANAVFGDSWNFNVESADMSTVGDVKKDSHGDKQVHTLHDADDDKLYDGDYY